MADNNVMQNILNAQQLNEAKVKAQVELAQLKMDGAWVQKYMSGDVEAVRKMRDLQSAIAGVPAPALPS
jgi:hypothetical protein